jgi:imidazolonepropionase-like amidohydrolase
VVNADLLVTADAGWTGGAELHGPLAVAITGSTVTWAGAIADAPVTVRRLHVDGVVLPGLVDHHVHTTLIDTSVLLSAGLTAVRDLGAPVDAVFDLVRRSSLPLFDGPRVLAAGPFLTAPGGYPTGRDWAASGMAWEISDAEAGAAAVRSLATYRPVTVKVALNAAAGPVPTDDVLAAIVTAAHGSGIPVTAHCEGPGQVERAVESGVDELAHTPFEEPLGDELAARLAARVAVVSTLDIHGWGERTGQRTRAVDNLARFRRAGGRVRYGTDLGNGPLPLGVNAREVAALGDAGLGAREVLDAMTIGPLAPGSSADVVAVPSDPLHDPLVLARAEPVLRAGRPRGGYSEQDYTIPVPAGRRPDHGGER